MNDFDDTIIRQFYNIMQLTKKNTIWFELKDPIWSGPLLHDR